MTEQKKYSITSLSQNELLFLRIIRTCSHEISHVEFDSLFTYLRTLFDTTIVADQHIPLYIDLCFFFAGYYREKRMSKDSTSFYQACSEYYETFYQKCLSSESYVEMKNNTYTKISLKDAASAYAATLAFQNIEANRKDDDESEAEELLTYNFQYAIFRDKKDKYKRIVEFADDYLDDNSDEVLEFKKSLVNMYEQSDDAASNILNEFESQDFWEIIHFETLPEKSTRMGFRQIARSKNSFGEIHPSTRSEIMNVLRNEMSLDPDVEKYPIGGFAEMTNKGDFDNINRTEFVYVGEKISENIDLFDLRMVQTETLYYTRDQSISFDPKRYLLIEIKSLKDICYKAKDQPYQVKVITIAIISKFIDDFISIFKKTASKIDIVCEDEDRNIFQTIYQYEIEKGFINLIKEVDSNKYSGVICVNKDNPEYISLIPGNEFKIKNEGKVEKFIYSEINMRSIVDSLLLHTAKIRNRSFFISLKESQKNKARKETTV